MQTRWVVTLSFSTLVLGRGSGSCWVPVAPPSRVARQATTFATTARVLPQRSTRDRDFKLLHRPTRGGEAGYYLSGYGAPGTGADPPGLSWYPTADECHNAGVYFTGPQLRNRTPSADFSALSGLSLAQL